MSLLVLGTVALDTVKTPFGIRKNMLGGSAVHFAMSARLFTKVHLVAPVGRDFPKKHIDFLEAKGIDLTSLIQAEGESFKWKGKYEGDLNHAVTLKTELGVLTSFRPRVWREQRKIKYIFLANLDPEIQTHLLKQMHSPRLVGADSMNFWINNKRKAILRMLRLLDIYTANEHEARSLSGQTNLINAARFLHSYGPRFVIIKKGEHGSLLYGENIIFLLPAYPVGKVIDPTGAGDTFAGGFMGYLAKSGKVNAANLKKAIAFGTVAASFNVEGFGVEKTSRINLKDLEARLKEFKKCSSF
jgi:sugar/nucleoside kinase (ribokinase family)